MKSNTLTAALTIFFGLVITGVGAILLSRSENIAHYTLMSGLLVVFVGYVLLVVRLFHKR